MNKISQNEQMAFIIRHTRTQNTATPRISEHRQLKSHGNSLKCHGKVMELYYQISVGTLFTAIHLNLMLTTAKLSSVFVIIVHVSLCGSPQFYFFCDLPFSVGLHRCLCPYLILFITSMPPSTSLSLRTNTKK